MGKALHRYRMIAHGDRIIVGVSGGADSLSLMWMLSERRARIPIDYELIAVYIDPGFEGSFAEVLQAYCERLGFALRVEYTDYGVVSYNTVVRIFNSERIPESVAVGLQRLGKTALKSGIYVNGK